MKKINLKKLTVYGSIDKTNRMICDITKDLADYIYLNTNGIANHALALKIYNSEGTIEINEEEEELLKQDIQSLKPCVIDAIMNALEDNTNNKN